MAKTKKPPASYLNRRRPDILEAIKAEGDILLVEALEILKRKGYFTPPPRPWKVAFRDRGHGHGDFAVIDRFGDVVAEVARCEIAELIVNAVNASGL